MNGGVSDEKVIPHSYKILRRDRGARVGGVSFLTKAKVACTAFVDAQDAESVFSKIRINGISIILRAVYRPPSDRL